MADVQPKGKENATPTAPAPTVEPSKDSDAKPSGAAKEDATATAASSAEGSARKPRYWEKEPETFTSDEIKDKLTALFNKADVSDGTLSKAQVQHKTFSAAKADQTLDEHELRFRLDFKAMEKLLKPTGILDKLDNDGNGILSPTELMKSMDKDGDGKISLEEFLEALGFADDEPDTTCSAKTPVDDDADKAKAEAEAKEKEEVAAKNKPAGDTEAKADADAETKQKADAVAKAKADVDAAAKAKADVAAKEKVDAAAKAKEDVAAKEKADTAAKAKADVAAKEKADAAAKELVNVAMADAEAPKNKPAAAAEVKDDTDEPEAAFENVPTEPAAGAAETNAVDVDVEHSAKEVAFKEEDPVSDSEERPKQRVSRYWEIKPESFTTQEIRIKLQYLFEQADVADGSISAARLHHNTLDEDKADAKLDEDELRYRLDFDEMERILAPTGILEKLDVDGNGILSPKELLKALDKDGDGKISLEEFLDGLTNAEALAAEKKQRFESESERRKSVEESARIEAQKILAELDKKRAAEDKIEADKRAEQRAKKRSAENLVADELVSWRHGGTELLNFHASTDTRAAWRRLA